MHISLVSLGLALTLVACAGEVSSPSIDEAVSAQQVPVASAGAPSDATRTESSSPPNANGEFDPTATDYPVPTWGSTDGCMLDPGPAASGVCEVGTSRRVEKESSGGTGVIRGTQLCINVNGVAYWSEPTFANQSSIPTSRPYGDTNLFIGKRNSDCAYGTPLVLSFDERPVTFLTTATGSFNLTQNEMSIGSDWPSAATPWLALDRDGNGTIDDGSELFGSRTRLAAGGFAAHGFDALAELDDNHDGVFDAADATFAKVVVWTDRNADRVSQRSELTSLAEAGVTSIALHHRRAPRCDVRGNCENERSGFTAADGRQGAVVDVYLLER